MFPTYSWLNRYHADIRVDVSSMLYLNLVSDDPSQKHFNHKVLRKILIQRFLASLQRDSSKEHRYFDDLPESHSMAWHSFSEGWGTWRNLKWDDGLDE